MKKIPNYSPENLALLKEQTENFWANIAGISSLPIGLPTQAISNLTVKFLGMTHDFDLEDTYGMPNLFLFNKGKCILAYRTALDPVEISQHFPKGFTIGMNMDIDFVIKGHQIYKGTTLTLITQCAFYPVSERPQIFKENGDLRSRIDFHGVPAPIGGQYRDGQLRECNIEQFNPKEPLAVKPPAPSPKKVVQGEQLKLF